MATASTSYNYSQLNNQAVSGASALSSVNGAGKGNTLTATSAQDMQNNFLKLLTAQLNAQDPLNPMDNSQVTSQMAQISQVAGIQSLNQTMQQMVGAQSATQSMMAASMIGSNVLVAGNSLPTPAAGKQTQAGVMLSGPAASMQVDVLDKYNNVVDSFTESNPSAGMNTFSWDGTDGKGNALPAGNYTFQVKVAQSSANGSTTATAYNMQQVKAVSWVNGSPMLVLPDNSQVPLSSVAQMS